MAQNKTQPTSASVGRYIASRATAEQRADCKKLMALCRRLTGHRPKMWGPSIVGYGSCRYACEGGRSGEMPLAAFAVRGRQLVVYLDCEGAGNRVLLSGLGKHKTGKSCLYFRRLSDLNASVLERLVAESVARARRASA